MYQYYRVYLYTVFPEEKCLPEILDIVWSKSNMGMNQRAQFNTYVIHQ